MANGGPIRRPPPTLPKQRSGPRKPYISRHFSFLTCGEVYHTSESVAAANRTYSQARNPSADRRLRQHFETDHGRRLLGFQIALETAYNVGGYAIHIVGT